MSISAIYDDTKADIAIRNMTEWQLSTTLGELNQNKARIHKFHKERKSLEDVKTTNTKAAIDYEYAVKEMMAAIENRKRLIQRYNDLAKELDENNPVLFNDDIPYEKVIPQPSVTITPEEPATEPKSSSEKKDSSVISQYGRHRRPRDRRGNKLKRKFFKNKIKRKNRR